MNLKNLIQELKRRNVFKVATAYIIAGWLIIQIVSSVFPVFKFPAWTSQFVIILVLIGFPIAIILAWAFELTPDGVKRTGEVPEEHSITQTTGKKLNNAFLVLLSLAVLLLLYKVFFGKPSPAVNKQPLKPSVSDTTTIPSKSIAVLPFENLSTDKANAYFADGMQDEILTKLAQLGNLKVISRTSVEQYKSHPGNLKTIGNELGVRTVLEGSVQKAGDQIRVIVQLINVRNDSHIWAMTYTRKLKDVFTVQTQIADNITKSLKLKLLPADERNLEAAPTNNAQAYDLYLKARYDMHRYINTGVLPRNAIRWYHQAIQLDTTFALAYADLAKSELFWSYYKNKDSLRHQALIHAKTALNINPNLAEGHLQLGKTYQAIDSDNNRAEKEFTSAYSLAPKNPDILNTLANMDINAGKWDSALAKLKKAFNLDPRNRQRLEDLANINWQLRHYSEALRLCDQARKLDPSDSHLLYVKAQIFVSIGRNKEARAIMKNIETEHYSDIATIAAYVIYGQIDFHERKYKQWLKNLGTSDSLMYLYSKNNHLDIFKSEHLNKLISTGEIYNLIGKKNQARSVISRAMKQIDQVYPGKTNNDHIKRLTSKAFCEMFLDQREKAITNLQNALKLTDINHHYLQYYRLLGDLSRTYAYFGDADHALPLIKEVFEAKGTGRIMPGYDLEHVIWDPIRKDPRFQALVRKYNPREKTVNSKQ